MPVWVDFDISISASRAFMRLPAEGTSADSFASAATESPHCSAVAFAEALGPSHPSNIVDIPAHTEGSQAVAKDVGEGEDEEEFDDEADVLFLGTGALSRWKWPDIAGLDTFKGTVLHSAQFAGSEDKEWQEFAQDWADKRVGVVGNVRVLLSLNSGRDADMKMHRARQVYRLLPRCNHASRSL